MTDDNGDITLYPSVEAAQREMEGIDVLDGVYDVFDRRGSRLCVTVDDGLVHIWLDPGVEPEPDELLGRLHHFVT